MCLVRRTSFSVRSADNKPPRRGKHFSFVISFPFVRATRKLLALCESIDRRFITVSLSSDSIELLKIDLRKYLFFVSLFSMTCNLS